MSEAFSLSHQRVSQRPHPCSGWQRKQLAVWLVLTDPPLSQLAKDASIVQWIAGRLAAEVTQQQWRILWRLRRTSPVLIHCTTSPGVSPEQARAGSGWNHSRASSALTRWWALRGGEEGDRKQGEGGGKEQGVAIRTKDQCPNRWTL